MHCFVSVVLLVVLSHSIAEAALISSRDLVHRNDKIKPKVFIISMFAPEAEVWWDDSNLGLLAQNITIPGLSPLFPQVHCTENGDVCQVVTGESEINAATTISALTLSNVFDLTTTYMMVAGIAGVSPKVGTLGSVTFARFAIQVALAYEFDAREIPDNFTTGYIPLGATAPAEYPQNIYGTEVFELNTILRDRAVGFARSAVLNDTETAAAYRAKYSSLGPYAAATLGPSVIPCDVATSDVYFSGTLLSEAFENITILFTNSTGQYCTTAQEDNATLEALLRSAQANLVDFGRILVMRTASDFDRPYLNESDVQNLFYFEQGGFAPAIQNIYLAGIKVVQGIIDGWNEFELGIESSNYIGDIFGTLGGTPDFGLPSQFLSAQPQVSKFRRRGLQKGRQITERAEARV